MWNPFRRSPPPDPVSDPRYQQVHRRLVEQAPAPVLWLFGKTGSGKSSITRYLTGTESIEIGSGYRPQTRFTSEYAFPNESEPLLRFLDTRGLGEVAYDPREDIEALSSRAHLMIVVVRAMDHALAEILSALRAIRAASPRRPVILALTALHDAAPGQQHPDPDPFPTGLRPLPEGISEELRRSLEYHYDQFEGLYDVAAPLDLTPLDEGFHQPQFGGPRLKAAILDSLPAAYRQTLLQLEEVVSPLRDATRERAFPVILGSSTLAATAAALPLPWVDIPVVLGLQTHLVYKLARIHRQEIDSTTIARVSGVIGGQVALRMALRAALKFIPWVGMAANAAAAFAYTYATGMVWSWYFTTVREGHLPTDAELRDVFQKQLMRAAELWKTTHAPPAADPTPPA